METQEDKRRWHAHGPRGVLAPGGTAPGVLGPGWPAYDT